MCRWVTSVSMLCQSLPQSINWKQMSHVDLTESRPLCSKDWNSHCLGHCRLFFSLLCLLEKIPAEWSRAIVTPVYKGSLSSDVSNIGNANYCSWYVVLFRLTLMVKVILHTLVVKREGVELPPRPIFSLQLQNPSGHTLLQPITITNFSSFNEIKNRMCEAMLKISHNGIFRHYIAGCHLFYQLCACLLVSFFAIF